MALGQQPLQTPLHNAPYRARFLVFNCHEPWIYQLGSVEQAFDIIVGLQGRHTLGWDFAMRPLPENAQLVSLEQARAQSQPYDCIIAHNFTDLLQSKGICAPRLFVIHNTLENLVIERNSQTTAAEVRTATARYLDLVGAEAVAVSELKARSWGINSRVVQGAADAGQYRPYIGDLAVGLRVANDVRRKLRTLLWDFHESAFAGLPIKLVGRNNEISGANPSKDWDDLKNILSHHRFFIHTADPQIEDGYNMAMLEAMTAGLPVLGNRHPSSPVEHGKSGFLSDDAADLRRYAILLLEDRELAMRMGEEARKVVLQKSTPQKFARGLRCAIKAAKK